MDRSIDISTGKRSKRSVAWSIPNVNGTVRGLLGEGRGGRGEGGGPDVRVPQSKTKFSLCSFPSL